MIRSLKHFGIGTGAAATVAAAAAALVAMPVSPAHACGGLFCSSSNPVNQAAEQIIFVDNHDGTTTAVIQILYEGPAHEFAWILPVAGTPEVGVSSEQALNAVKQATNPQYSLQTTFADSCGANFSNGVGLAGAPTAALPQSDSGSGVTIVDSGAVGPYMYETIMVDPALDDRAQVAVDWLAANDYDIGDIGSDVLRPYLDENLNLIAIKLTKDSGTGSIRPIMLTYDSSIPSIPIRPTAVAANDDMGVMVFLLSDVRGIPKNYKALELNEALIDWFMPNNNYNQVVSKAADEAMGQGFVTEFAGPHAMVAFGQGVQIFAPWQRDVWNQFQAADHSDPFQMINEASNSWGGYDGFTDALREAVTLPETVAFSDFIACTSCYATEAGFAFDSTLFLRRLYELVIKPLIETQALFDGQPYLTRLYTTMSAEDMTMDPLFDFNPDLEDVSNVHTATREVQCSSASDDPLGPNVPWKVALPQGDVVAGTGTGVWPIAMASQPAALRILQYGTSGDGEVIEDNADLIAKMVEDDNEDPTTPMTVKPSEPTSGDEAGASGSDDDKTKTPSDDDDDKPAAADDTTDAVTAGDSGCNATHARSGDALSLLLLAGLGLLVRRRSLHNTQTRRPS